MGTPLAEKIKAFLHELDAADGHAQGAIRTEKINMKKAENKATADGIQEKNLDMLSACMGIEHAAEVRKHGKLILKSDAEIDEILSGISYGQGIVNIEQAVMKCFKTKNIKHR